MSGQVTDIESDIRDEFDNFVRTSHSQTQASLHLPDNESDEVEPLCDRANLHPDKGAPDYGKQSQWLRKSTKTYPPGYYPLCQYCVDKWDDDEEEDND